jgi:thiamine-monophosphate kinase
MTSEFALIARIRERARTRKEVRVGIGDDAAILSIPPGHDLVVAMDTLNAGIHFPADTAPRDIGWKALAVNLSDLAAMGAEPAFCTLSLSLPSTDIANELLDGFLELAEQHDVALVGGDTTRGPLSLSVTVHGYVPHDTALLRSGARAGDDVWITGTLGDAAGALDQWKRDLHASTTPARTALPRAENPTHSEALRARLDRPTPRIKTGLALRNLATACIDISDGLAADLGHVLAASHVGATLDATALPTSDALRASFDATTIHRLQLTGGDDYELCFTAPPEHRARCAALATRVGTIDAAPGLRIHGAHLDADHPGWDHFR